MNGAVAWLERPSDIVLARYAEAAYGSHTFRDQAAGVEVLFEVHRRWAVLAYRGTEFDGADILSDLRAVPWRDRRLGWCHSGFLKSVRDGLWPRIERVILDCPVPVYLTGHSLGGARAVITAGLMAAAGGKPAGLVTFGCPRVGMAGISRLLAGVPGRRYVRGDDVVPSVPVAGLVFRYRHDRPATRVGSAAGFSPFEDHKIKGYVDDVADYWWADPT